MTRSERFEIDLAATRKEVWERLTTAEGLASWFGTRAEIELRVGGRRVVGWGDSVEMDGVIAEVEAGHKLRVVYLADGEETGAEEWLLSSDDVGVTRLTLIQSFRDDDIDDWDGCFGDIGRGWRLFLASLRHGLEQATQPTRVADCVYLPAPVKRELIWELVGDAVAGSAVTAGLTTALEIAPHSRLLVAPDRTLLLDAEGAADAQVLYVQAATAGDGTDLATWRHEALDLAASIIQNR